MSVQMIQVNIPSVLLQRARVTALNEARELITFLLENYAQELERSQRQQAYETYYATQTTEEKSEELELLTEFSFTDAELSNERLA